MKLLSVVLLSVSCLGLSGCEVTGPKVKLKPPVVVEVEGGGKAKHCPPGQAKKGNC